MQFTQGTVRSLDFLFSVLIETRHPPTYAWMDITQTQTRSLNTSTVRVVHRDETRDRSIGRCQTGLSKDTDHRVTTPGALCCVIPMLVIHLPNITTPLLSAESHAAEQKRSPAKASTQTPIHQHRVLPNLSPPPKTKKKSTPQNTPTSHSYNKR